MRNIPRYEKLKQLLLEKLSDGRLQVGDRFHSQNELMKKYNLSIATVTRAMNELEREGFLVREQGRGTFVRAIPGAPNDTTRRRIAVFIPWDTRNPAHVNFRKIYKTIEEAFPPPNQIKLLPFSSDPLDMEAFLFTREQFDGTLLVYPGGIQLPIVSKLAQMTHTVVVGSVVENDQIGCVFCDNVRASQSAVNYLIERGHRNIGLISGALEMTDSKERVEGYRMALRQHGIPFNDNLVVYTSTLELNGYSGMLDLADRNSQIEMTAVFAAGDLIAMGALFALKSMSKRLPDDFSLIGFDDIDEAASFDPPLTTVHVPIAELARNGVTMLTEMMNGTGKPQRLELDTRIVERATVRPLIQVSAVS